MRTLRMHARTILLVGGYRGGYRQFALNGGAFTGLKRYVRSPWWLTVCWPVASIILPGRARHRDQRPFFSALFQSHTGTTPTYIFALQPFQSSRGHV